MSEATGAVSFTRDTAELAAAYDETGTPQFLHGQQLVASLRLAPGDKVLDIGAGTGRLAAHVAALVGDTGHVTAIDPLPLRISLAARKGAGNITTLVGAAEDLSAFADASFDAAYLNSVFHWVQDKPRALAEAFRVLKPGGRLALNTAAPERPHQSSILLRELLPSRDNPISVMQGLTMPALEAALRAAGFTGVEVTAETFVDHHESAEALALWSQSSSFGNTLSLSGADPAARAAFLARLAEKMEPYRTPQGIRLERYLNFAVARKP